MAHPRTSPADAPTVCRVVNGHDEVAACRAEHPDTAIVALVDPSEPLLAVLAQAAGADIVLPASGTHRTDPDAVPGLALAVEAATTIARQRSELARTSRTTGHDLAEALNAMALAAEVGTSGALPPGRALEHVAQLARDAGADAWRASRAGRAHGQSLTAVDVVEVVRAVSTARDDVEVVAPSGPVRVLADERRLTAAVAELVRNARATGAEQIRVRVSADPRDVSITVYDDGPGFAAGHDADLHQPTLAPSEPGRLGVGLATISELAAALGGSFCLAEVEGTGWATAVRLSLPALGRGVGEALLGGTAIDQATAQAAILEGVVRRAPLAESLDAIVAVIEEQLPGSACSVLLLRDGKTLHHGAGARLPAAYRAGIDGVEIGLGQGSCGTAAFLGRPVVASDVTSDPIWERFRDVATEHGLRSCWSTPIVAAEGGEVLGTFAVYKTSVWSPDRAAVALVQRFTYLAAVAIEHHRLFGALAESESRFRSAFEGAAAGMALVRLDGSLLKINPSLATLLGRPEEALLASNLLDLVHPERQEEIRASWALLASGRAGGPVPGPTPDVPLVTGSSDEHVWVSFNTSMIEAEGERYFYVEVRDMTATRRHLAEQRAREVAEASSLAKTEFLALVSHELRTPLNAILGFAQVMQLTDLDADQSADSIDQIASAGRHLRDLIDDLLDLSRIDAGQLAVETECLAPEQAIGEALDLVEPLAAARDISLRHDRGGPCRARVLADRRCLRQVLINLLGNAVKYTPAGGRVDIEVRELEDGHVRISVQDTGPGIADESFEDLFQPFQRLEHEQGRSEGTGLGLALAARLMAEMDGRIGVSSTVGSGSCFWIDLPPADGQAGPPPHSRTLLPDTTPAPGGVVLYVDDDRASVTVLEAALATRPRVELHAVHTATEAVSRLAPGDVDLLLLDIGLPDLSGWDLLRTVRTVAPDLPVLVLTAGGTEPPPGAPTPERLFTKPLDLPEVLGAIDLALGPSSLHDGVPQPRDPVEQ